MEGKAVKCQVSTAKRRDCNKRKSWIRLRSELGLIQITCIISLKTCGKLTVLNEQIGCVLQRRHPTSNRSMSGRRKQSRPRIKQSGWREIAKGGDPPPFSFLQMTKTISLLLLAVYLCPYPAMCQSQTAGRPQASPDEYAYAQPGGKELKLYVFQPPGGDHRGLRGAVVIFHGGGWNQGTAAWTFGQARYFASLGMAGISVEYRLANGEEVTPFECVADAKAAIQWVRRHAQELNIDAKRIAAYGESAGGLLAAASAITSEDATKEEKDSVPNALVLFSPALNADSSEHFQKMLRPGQDAGAILPELHIRGGMPATIIVTGELDKMPSAAKMAEFCEKMKRTHNRCELHIYPGVGHMLMSPGKDKEERDKASKTGFDAFLKIDLFLQSLGFLPPAPRKN